jgi:hypothetical protein
MKRQTVQSNPQTKSCHKDGLADSVRISLMPEFAGFHIVFGQVTAHFGSDPKRLTLLNDNDTPSAFYGVSPG